MIYPFLIFLILFIFPQNLSAISPTPTISTNITPTNMDEIQKIREVVQQKVQEKLKQIITPSSTKKGIIGKVTQTDNSSITIEYQSATKVLSLSTDTVYIDAKRNKTKLENIKVGQGILAMGINNADDNTFDAKRIVFIDLDTIISKKTIVVGKIVDISKTTSVFTLIPSKNKNSLYQIKTTATTEVNDNLDQKLKITDLKSGQKIIAVLIPDEKVSKTYKALKIINITDVAATESTVTPTKKP